MGDPPIEFAREEGSNGRDVVDAVDVKELAMLEVVLAEVVGPLRENLGLVNRFYGPLGTCGGRHGASRDPGCGCAETYGLLGPAG